MTCDACGPFFEERYLGVGAYGFELCFAVLLFFHFSLGWKMLRL
jgi:hypothetical protein